MNSPLHLSVQFMGKICVFEEEHRDVTYQSNFSMMIFIAANLLPMKENACILKEKACQSCKLRHMKI